MRLHDERGQITVFLALAFMVFLGLAFVILEGIHGYMESAIAQEAVMETGNEILANYDRYLFEKYHVLFLDPREKDYIGEDAEAFLNSYISSGFYGFHCLGLTVSDEKTAVDEKGLFLRYQIDEYMKYKKKVEMMNSLSQLLEESKGWSKDIEEGKHDFNTEEGSPAPSEEKDEKEEKEDTEPVSAETIRYRESWKQLKGVLKGIVRSGVLVYAADHPQNLSSLTISKNGLPSGGRGTGDHGSGPSSLPELSFGRLSDWRSFISSGKPYIPAGIDAISDSRLPEYMVSSFSFYGGEESANQKALRYELEYIAAGKTSDRENLKYVANRILFMRFIANYAYACTDPRIQSEAWAMGLALTGILGMPEAADAVKVLLVAALSYGESLLELHALLKGEKVALVKDSSNWNLSFEDAPDKLAARVSVKGVEKGVSYSDYLLFLSMMNSETLLLYRMMDIMQLNTALHEPGFCMKDCLFSFRWDIRLACGRWFVGFPGMKDGGGHYFDLNTERFVSY